MKRHELRLTKLSRKRVDIDVGALVGGWRLCKSHHKAAQTIGYGNMYDSMMKMWCLALWCGLCICVSFLMTLTSDTLQLLRMCPDGGFPFFSWGWWWTVEGMESELQYCPHTVSEVREDKQKNSLDLAGFEH
jgi:hypothetical protein